MISCMHIGAVAAAVKIAINSDPYFSSVKSLLHFEGTNGSTSFVDQKGNTWTASGSTISTTRSISGLSSGLFNGSGRVISDLPASDWNFLHNGTKYTFECSFYIGSLVSASRGLLGTNNGTAVNVGAGFYTYNDTIIVYITRGVAGQAHIDWQSGSVLSSNTWYTLSVSYDPSSSPICKVFLNGSLIGSPSQIYAAVTTNASLTASIGSIGSSSFYFNGYIDELRITNGVARYSASYTPSLPFPNQ